MPFVRRRPLLRAAAIGGVAYMGAKAGTNSAQAQQQAQAAAAPTEPPAAPAPVGTTTTSAAGDRIAQLQQLASLHDSGALTDDEFAAAKAQVLA